jgi:hypothetical protein
MYYLLGRPRHRESGEAGSGSLSPPIPVAASNVKSDTSHGVQQHEDREHGSVHNQVVRYQVTFRISGHVLNYKRIVRISVIYLQA